MFRLPTFLFLARRAKKHRLSDRQSANASHRAVDSRIVLVRANHCLHHFWRNAANKAKILLNVILGRSAKDVTVLLMQGPSPDILPGIDGISV
jgi:hypothetical protein